jgi:DNA-binding NarL/FixJ family response regulator
LLIHDIQVAGRDKTKVARDTFNALASRFPKIAQRLRSGLSEEQIAARMGWHIKSLRAVLSDYRSVLRRAKILTIDQWRQLLRTEAE